MMPLLALCLALLAFIFNNSISDTWVYQRELISQGELWRAFSAHFFHTNGFHLLLNGAAVILLWALHGQFYTVSTYSTVFIISAITCTLGIHFFSLNIVEYVGLSGVLHGIFIWGAIEDIKAKDKTGYLLLLGVILKIAHEQVYGASSDVASLIEASVAINAHLWGAIGGAIASALIFIYRSSIQTKN
jgi:rhomboid family GlyGly-CTERM serine protease